MDYLVKPFAIAELTERVKRRATEHSGVRDSRWLDGGDTRLDLQRRQLHPGDGRVIALPPWAAFATANVVAMFKLPGAETVPFHFVWISLTLVYGLQAWSLRRTYLVVAMVSVVTGAALALHVRNNIIGVEETTEVPLMAMVLLAVVWHVRHRTAAVREAGELAASEHAVREAQRRFVRLASHELRTPLTVARGYAELIRDGSANPQVAADAAIVLDELES